MGEAEGGKMMIILRGFAVLPCLRELQDMMFWKTNHSWASCEYHITQARWSQVIHHTRPGRARWLHHARKHDSGDYANHPTMLATLATWIHVAGGANIVWPLPDAKIFGGRMSTHAAERKGSRLEGVRSDNCINGKEECEASHCVCLVIGVAFWQKYFLLYIESSTLYPRV